MPSVHLQAWLLWKWFHFAHWTLIELTSSSFATNIHFDYVFWVRNSVFSMFFMHFQTMNLPANITSWIDFGLPGVSLSAIASILAERLFKNFSRGINRRDRRDARPMAGMGSKGLLKTGFVWFVWRRGRPQVHQPGEGCEDESMMWTRLKTDIWHVYACLPSGKIMSNFGPMHLLNGADSRPKSCRPERIEGLPREIVQAQPLLNFPSLGEPFWY